MGVSPSVLRSAVATAKRILASLLTDVSHEAYTGQSGSGAPTYGTAVTRSGAVDLSPSVVRRPDGSEIVSTARLVFLEQLTVTSRDRFTIGGISGVVQQQKAATDPTTGLPYALEIWIA